MLGLERGKFDVDLGLDNLIPQIPVGPFCIVPDSPRALIGYIHAAIHTQFHMKSIHSITFEPWKYFEVHGFLFTVGAARVPSTSGAQMSYLGSVRLGFH